MKYAILILTALAVSACSSEDNINSENLSNPSMKTFSTEVDAQNSSPINEACLVAGEIKTETVCVPTNRGKNGKCENQVVTTDTRIWESAFARGDVDYDGLVGTREDAQTATKKLYVKQFDNQPCPAAADIAPHEGIHDSYSPDGFFTSNDINQWREVRQTGLLPLSPHDAFICASSCQIPNHMAK